MAQKEPEKKMPSTAAKPTRRSAKESEPVIHLIAQSAFRLTHGTVSIAWNSLCFSAASLMYVSSSSEYISEWMFSMATWKP